MWSNNVIGVGIVAYNIILVISFCLNDKAKRIKLRLESVSHNHRHHSYVPKPYTTALNTMFIKSVLFCLHVVNVGGN